MDWIWSLISTIARRLQSSCETSRLQTSLLLLILFSLLDTGPWWSMHGAPCLILVHAWWSMVLHGGPCMVRCIVDHVWSGAWCADLSTGSVIASRWLRVERSVCRFIFCINFHPYQLLSINITLNNSCIWCYLLPKGQSWEFLQYSSYSLH